MQDEISALEEQLSESNLKVKNITTTLENTSGKLTQAESDRQKEITALNQKLQAKQKELDDLKALDLEGQIKKLKHQLEDAQKKFDSNEYVHVEIEEVKGQLTAAQKDLGNAHSKNELLSSTLSMILVYSF